jgi:hypothetical protein
VIRSVCSFCMDFTRTTPATATRSSAPVRNMSCTSVRSQGWLRLGRARLWKAKIASRCATFIPEGYGDESPCLRDIRF